MKLDFQDIFTGKEETDRINREYARGLARDAAKDKLKQDFVMDLSRQVFIDGPEKAKEKPLWLILRRRFKKKFA